MPPLPTEAEPTVAPLPSPALPAIALGSTEPPGPRPLSAGTELRPTAMWHRLTTVGETLAQGRVAVRDWLGGSAYPLAAYDQFRRDFPVRPPPGALPDPGAGAVIVCVEAQVAAPFLVRATLRSLQDQSVQRWRAVVAASASTLAHPVASFAEVDPRIVFVAVADALTEMPPQTRHVLSVTAGTVLDPEALAWLLFAAERTGAEAIYADHDHGVDDAEGELTRADPWLPGLLDRDALNAAAVALFSADRARDAMGELAGGGFRRSALAGAHGPVPHVARLLATVLELPLAAREAKKSADDDTPGRLGPVPDAMPARAVPAQEGRIGVIIPTRDAADLLARDIDRLRETARDPARVDIVVVDNRSSEPETLNLFRRLEAEGAARIVPMDAPFHWGLASNIGADATTAPVLLFANNDMEMLTSDWDDLVLDALAVDDVGAIGARLLYPDMTVQHGGMVFGMGIGRAEHEGRGRAYDDPGPARRLVTTRSVAAVTGAFLGVRRSLFDAVGRFDVERMFVGHSDVDFCLKVREAGKRVVYLADVEMIHFESKTRGRDETKAQIAWDEAERGELIARWGSSVNEDPGIDPYWSPRGELFDALREPSLRAVVRHLDITARALPWRPSRREAQEAASWRQDRL